MIYILCDLGSLRGDAGSFSLPIAYAGTQDIPVNIVTTIQGLWILDNRKHKVCVCVCLCVCVCVCVCFFSNLFSKVSLFLVFVCLQDPAFKHETSLLFRKADNRALFPWQHSVVTSSLLMGGEACLALNYLKIHGGDMQSEEEIKLKLSVFVGNSLVSGAYSILVSECVCVCVCIS